MDEFTWIDEYGNEHTYELSADELQQMFVEAMENAPSSSFPTEEELADMAQKYDGGIVSPF